MKWIGISGGWRKITPEIENEVRRVVREIILRGDGIVSGGALGVDFIVLDEALKNNPEASRIKIFLPTTFKKYTAHYRRYKDLGTFTKEQGENLIVQLTKLREANKDALIENPDPDFNDENKKEKYYARNSQIVTASDELLAFHVKTKKSEGLGTQDTIEKAKEKGIPVKIQAWDLTEGTIN